MDLNLRTDPETGAPVETEASLKLETRVDETPPARSSYSERDEDPPAGSAEVDGKHPGPMPLEAVTQSD